GAPRPPLPPLGRRALAPRAALPPDRRDRHRAGALVPRREGPAAPLPAAAAREPRADAHLPLLQLPPLLPAGVGAAAAAPGPRPARAVSRAAVPAAHALQLAVHPGADGAGRVGADRTRPRGGRDAALSLAAGHAAGLRAREVLRARVVPRRAHARAEPPALDLRAGLVAAARRVRAHVARAPAHPRARRRDHPHLRLDDARRLGAVPPADVR